MSYKMPAMSIPLHKLLIIHWLVIYNWVVAQCNTGDMCKVGLQ